MGKFYFTKKEIRQSPSVQKGFKVEYEQFLRYECALYIYQMGATLNLSMTSTIPSAMVYFHRFYMVHSFQDVPRFPMATACLFLAGKVEETPKKCKDILKCVQSILPPKTLEQEFGPDPRTWIDTVMTFEKVLLQSTKFHMEFEHPYSFILNYMNSLKGDKEQLNYIGQQAWSFIHDSWATTLCIQWEPELIAIAAIFLAAKLSQIEINDWEGRLPNHQNWYDLFVENLANEVLEYICHEILDIYHPMDGACGESEAMFMMFPGYENDYAGYEYVGEEGEIEEEGQGEGVYKGQEGYEDQERFKMEEGYKNAHRYRVQNVSRTTSVLY